MMEEELTKIIIGSAMEIHRYWGPGLLESIYMKSLVIELVQQEIVVQNELPITLKYKGLDLTDDFRLDLLVENKVIVELKAVQELAPIHEAQLLTYLKLTKCRIGLLINFNVTQLRNGIKRVVL